MQWAVTGRLDDEPLIEACLRDQRFDAQIDSSRADWLWHMVRAVGSAERFRVPILHALYDLSDNCSAQQLCDLARHYAEMGDETFHTRLCQIVEQKPLADSPWLGEEAVIKLDGERGFMFAAQVRGRLLASREWEWDDGGLVDLAAERFGAEHVSRLLAASSDEAICRFRENWLQDQKRRAEERRPMSYRERMTAIPLGEILQAAKGDGRFSWFRGWGKYASEADLRAVLQGIGAAYYPQEIVNLLKVFSDRAMPELDVWLVDLCQLGDEEITQQALRALAQNANPLVRELALTELQNGIHDGSVVSLFINNYRQGDEDRILEALELPNDPCELHWLLMAVIKLLEANPEADCSRLAVMSYTLTPCENCRYYAARLLLGQQGAPDWLTRECRYDSNEDCRKLAEKAAGLSSAS
jgi:hypothetical protein